MLKLTLDEIASGYCRVVLGDQEVGTVCTQTSGGPRWAAITPENAHHNPETAPVYALGATAEEAAIHLVERWTGVPYGTPRVDLVVEARMADEPEPMTVRRTVDAGWAVNAGRRDRQSFAYRVIVEEVGRDRDHLIQPGFAWRFCRVGAR